MKPLLSILVATRNRIPYCINLIEAILLFEYENFELVIQDNSDSQELSKFALTKTNDKRLVYNYTPPPFSSIDNFNEVLKLASGDYVCLLGDDDGVLFEIFELVEWAKQNNIQGIYPKFTVMYRWPDACSLLPQYSKFNGNLEIFDFNGKIEYCNVKKNYNSLLDYSGLNLLNLKAPKLYHGIIKRSCIEDYKNKLGFYVGGLSPDIYFAVALSQVIKTFVFINYPIFVSGVCKVPILERMNVQIDLPHQAPHYRNRGQYEWSSKVPYFYSPENIWSDSLIAALKDLKLESDSKKVNLNYLYHILQNKYPERIDEIRKVSKLNSTYFKYISFFYTVNFKLKNSFNKVLNKLSNFNRKPNVNFDNIVDIKSAIDKTQFFLKENNIKLNF